MAGPPGHWPSIGREPVIASVVAMLGGAGRARQALIRAPLGGGKSRCLDDITEVLEARGRAVRRIHASSTLQSVPFGAVAHLLPVGARETGDPVALIGALRDVLATGGSAAPVVMIDDLPWLDVATAGVVASLVTTGEIRLVAGARTGETLPMPLVETFLGERSMVVELNALSDPEMETLLQAVLGGTVDQSVIVSLRERSGGNPLFLRELTRGALDTGVLHVSSGVWRLRGELPASTRLHDMVASRLNTISQTQRAAIELLAVCDEVDLEELEGLLIPADLMDLEARGLLVISDRFGRMAASLSQPLHAEAIRTGLPALRSRMVLREHLTWLKAHPESLNGDPLQRAIWRLDAGLATDREQLLQGARLAAVLQDPVCVLRLAQPAFEADPTAETAALLADAYFQTGQWAAAYATLDRADALSATPTLRVDLGVTRATILLWGVGDKAAAKAVLEQLRADPQMSPENQLRLSAEYASVLVHSGNPGQALAELEAVTAVSTDLQTQLGAAVSLANALGMAGRTAQAVAVIDDSLSRRPAHNLTAIAGVDTHLVTKGLALVEAGRLDAAMALATDGYERSVLNSQPLTQYWFALLVARISLLRGFAATALRQFTGARALGADAGLRGPTRTAVVGIALSHAMMGDAEGAALAVQELEQLPPFGFMAPETALAHGWLSVANGNLMTGRELLAAGAADAVATGHMTSAIWMLHDVARLGGAEAVLDRISALAATTDSWLSQARATHVRAMVHGDTELMVQAGDRFAACGANLLAAEALVSASELALAAGDQRLSRSLGGRASNHLAVTEAAPTPALIAGGGTVQPLTDREREIAFLAATGLTSREIGEQLFVSARTVSNHLQHVYDKLGVRGRAELKAALSERDW